MILEVFGKRSVPEKILRLNLEEYNGKVVLLAVDANGNRLQQGNLLVISSQGVERCGAVDRDFGFPVDSEGRVMDVTK